MQNDDEQNSPKKYDSCDFCTDGTEQQIAELRARYDTSYRSESRREREKNKRSKRAKTKNAEPTTYSEAMQQGITIFMSNPLIKMVGTAATSFVNNVPDVVYVVRTAIAAASGDPEKATDFVAAMDARCSTTSGEVKQPATYSSYQNNHYRK